MEKKIQKIWQKELEIAMPISKSMTQSLLEQSSDAIIFADKRGKITFWNSKAVNVFGFSREEIVGKPLVSLMPKSYEIKHNENIHKLFNNTESIHSGTAVELECLRKNGKTIWVEMTLTAIKDGQKFVLASIVRDISKRIKLQQKLFQQAITDPLTGVYNRRHFDEMLKTEFERANRYKKSFSVIVMDIDSFKQINDKYGHLYGDKVLINATEIFADVLRTVDSVYRYGGDEFGIILPETTKAEALEVAERLRSRFAKKCKIKDGRIKLSLSIGLVSFPEEGRDEKSLVSAADRRMYHSKGEGGNIVTAYTVNEIMGTKYGALLKSLTSLTVLMEESRQSSPWLGISHTEKTKVLAMEIGRKLGLPAKRISMIEQASKLHDIGMLFISREIFNKIGKLTKDDLTEVKKHPLIGEEILELILSSLDNQVMADIPKIVGQHHEWVNGLGYPRGLKNENILIEAKILHLADAYEAMTSVRPYRKDLKKQDILQELKKYSGKQFDPQMVEILCEKEFRIK